jgi:hypothetical protein
MNALFTSFALLLISFQVFADENSNNHNPIGNYNYIEIGLAKTTEANSICSGSECYKTLRGTELTASLNFESVPHLLISASSSSEGASGLNSDLTYSVGKLLVGLIGGFGSVDAAVSVSGLSASTLTCPSGSNVCQVVLENGTDYGAMVKLWLGENKDFNLGVNVDRYSYAPSSANISSRLFGTWLPARHHSLSIAYNSAMDINHTPISSGGSFSYSYLF